MFYNVKVPGRTCYTVKMTAVNTPLTTALRILVDDRLIDLFAVRCTVQLRIQEAKVQDVFAELMPVFYCKCRIIIVLSILA